MSVRIEAVSFPPGPILVFNLSRPEKSLMLLAPLAKEAGGWGLCANVPRGSASRSKSRTTSPVFANTADPGYQGILAMINAGRKFVDRNNCFDMTGFVPRGDWFREMKRYGLVPQCVKPEEVTDVYTIEQDYWRSLWHQPAQQ